MTAQPYRVLFFVFDGTGLGHLTRVSRLADAVQGPCASLVVTGMREASWIVSEECEFLHIPSWNGLRETRASYWDRSVWLNIPYADAMRMRKNLVQSVFDSFAPDAIVVDYLPFGRDDELLDVLRMSRARKYLVLRGIVDKSDMAQLGGAASQKVADIYDTIVVTADRRMVDVAAECHYSADAAKCVRYVGYVMPKSVNVRRVRAERGIVEGTSWIVCAAGGGIFAESFLTQCTEIAADFPQVEFDVVFGPLSNAARAQAQSKSVNCRVHREWRSLPDAQAACDVLISSGGYNSLLEAASGGARVIVFPSRTGDDDEQLENARRLSAFYPVRLLESAAELPLILTSESRLSGQERAAFCLNADGAVAFRAMLLDDLSRAPASSDGPF